MSKTWPSIYSLASVMLMLACSSCRSSGAELREDKFAPAMLHPAVALIRLYEMIDYSGPISVIPYFGSLYILDLQRREDSLDRIRPFLDWQMSHLNYPDKHGLTGSIYDYEINPDGSEYSLEDYDSVDSYSALLLITIYQYYQQTGDTQFVERHKANLLDIAYTIVHLQKDEGLTWAKPDYPAKYLMDNCEAFGGLNAFTLLAREREWEEAGYYENQRDEIADGIATLYDEEAGNFAWVLEDNRRQPSNWTKFYPDAYAQLFPVYYRIPTVEPKVRKRLWEKFNSRYKNHIATLPVEQQVMYMLTKASAEKGFE